MIKPSRSSSERLLLLELKSDTDFVTLDDISDATNAALTSGANVFQDSKIAAGNNGEGKLDASSLFRQDRIELGSKQQDKKGFSDEIFESDLPNRSQCKLRRALLQSLQCHAVRVSRLLVRKCVSQNGLLDLKLVL
jgi:hypothetical protein